MDPFARDIRVNTFDRQLPVPIVYGRTLVAGQIIFIGDVKKVRRTDGGGKGEADNVYYTYKADFAMCLGEGTVTAVHGVWRADEERTDKEGIWWHWRDGTQTEIEDEVTEAAIVDAVPWTNTSFLMWQGNIGKLDVLPTVAAEVSGIIPAITQADTLGTDHDFGIPVACQWDAWAEQMHLLLPSTNGMRTVDRQSANAVTTALPDTGEMTEVTAFGVWPVEQMAVFLGPTDGSYDRYFYLCGIGAGADDSHAIVDQLNLEEWGWDIDAYAMDQKWGRLYAVVRDTDNSKIVILRLDLSDMTESKWELPGRAPADFVPMAMYFDPEFDDVYVCGANAAGGTVDFVRGNFGAAALDETNAVSDSVVGNVGGFGHAGDFVIGLDTLNGKVFRFAWDDLTTFESFGAPGDGTTAEGLMTDPTFAYFSVELGRLCVLDDLTTKWAVYMTGTTARDGSYEPDDDYTFGPLGWSYVAETGYENVYFTRLGDGPGAVYDVITNERYGAGFPTELMDLNSFDETAGHCASYVRNGDTDVGNVQYGFRWSTNVAITQRVSLISVLAGLLDTFAGHLVWQNGKLRLFCERPIHRVVFRADPSSISKESFHVRGTDRREVKNQIRIEFTDKDEQYRHDFVHSAAEWDQVATGETRQRAFKIDGITDKFKALRMTRLMLDAGMSNTQILQAKLEFVGLGVPIGDGITFEHDLAGWSGEKLFRIRELKETVDGKTGVACQEYTAEIFRTPMEDDVQDGTFGTGNPGEPVEEEFDFMAPPIGVRVIEDRYRPSVLLLHAVAERAGNLDRQWLNTQFEIATSIAGTYALQEVSEKKMRYFVSDEDILIDETSIKMDPRAILGGEPSNNEWLHFLIEDEVIFGQYKRATTTFESCQRGQRGTAAAAHAYTLETGTYFPKIYTLTKGFPSDDVRDFWSDVTNPLQDSDVDTFANIMWGEGSLLCIAIPDADIATLNQLLFDMRPDTGPQPADTTTGGPVYWEYSASTDGATWKRLPIVRDRSKGFSNDGDAPHLRDFYYDPPYDWAKTDTYDADGNKFMDGVARYWIRARQTRKKKRNSGCLLKRLQGVHAPVAIEYDEQQATRWIYTEEQKGVTYYVRATNTGNGYRNDEEQSPIETVTILSLASAYIPISALWAEPEHVGPVEGYHYGEGNAKLKQDEAVTFYWSSALLTGGYGQGGWDSSVWGGAKPGTFQEFEYKVERNSNLKRSGTTTVGTFIYPAATNESDHGGTFRDDFVFSVRGKTTDGVYTDWVEIQMETF